MFWYDFKFQKAEQFTEKFLKNNDVGIIHFFGGTKPWQYENQRNNPLYDHYYSCIRKIPWKDFEYTNRTLLGVLKRFVVETFLESFSKASIRIY